MLDLNVQQQMAIQSPSRIIYVDAGVGTGKTTTLKAKIKECIRSGIKPWHIVVLAFNNEIVKELKTELTGEFWENITGMMKIYTFHGYARKILGLNKVAIRLELFDEKVFEKFVRSLWSKFKKDNKLKGRNPKEARDETSFVVDMVNKCRENNSCVKEYDKIYREFYKTLKKELKQIGAYDFARILKVAKNKLIQSSEPLYIFVDEFQDTSEARFNFIKALVGESNYLFAVGDENQQILGWSGIKNINLEKLKQCYEQELSIYKLDCSYRLTPLLAQKSNNLLSVMHNGETKKLIGCNNVDPIYIIKKFNSPQEEAEWCVNYIKDLIDKGIEPKNIGVLYRNSNIISREIVETEVKCSTIHKAKGLEFDSVILLGLEEGIFPCKNSNIEEEMRVLYVGMTRAKRSLIITYIEDSYRNNIYVKPSRFLQYIK